MQIELNWIEAVYINYQFSKKKETIFVAVK